MKTNSQAVSSEHYPTLGLDQTDGVSTLKHRNSRKPIFNKLSSKTGSKNTEFQSQHALVMNQPPESLNGSKSIDENYIQEETNETHPDQPIIIKRLNQNSSTVLPENDKNTNPNNEELGENQESLFCYYNPNQDQIQNVLNQSGLSVKKKSFFNDQASKLFPKQLP